MRARTGREAASESKRLPRGEQLGATVYELGPGNFCVYHFHHAAEECSSCSTAR